MHYPLSTAQKYTPRYDLIKQVAEKLDAERARSEQEDKTIEVLKTTEQLWLR